MNKLTDREKEGLYKILTNPDLDRGRIIDEALELLQSEEIKLPEKGDKIIIKSVEEHVSTVYFEEYNPIKKCLIVNVWSNLGGHRMDIYLNAYTWQYPQPRERKYQFTDAELQEIIDDTEDVDIITLARETTNELDMGKVSNLVTDNIDDLIRTEPVKQQSSKSITIIDEVIESRSDGIESRAWEEVKALIKEPVKHDYEKELIPGMPCYYHTSLEPMIHKVGLFKDCYHDNAMLIINDLGETIVAYAIPFNRDLLGKVEG